MGGVDRIEKTRHATPAPLLSPAAWKRWLQKAASYDLFPQWSAKVRRFVYTPLGILSMAAVVALLCGLVLHPRVLALCGGLLAVIVVGMCWPWLTLRGVHATVSHPRERAVEGERVEATLTVVNRLPWPAWGLVVRGGYSAADTDQAESRSRVRDNGVEDADSEIRLATVAGRSRTLHGWSFTPRRRGVYPRQGARLATAFPFGVWEFGKRVQVSRELIVWPRTYPVGPVPWADDESIVEGNVARNKVGSTGDILGVRPYRRGDSPRRIHWPQSARHDRLIVCELQATHRPVVQIVVDTDPASHSGRGSHSSREWAIRIAASFAKGWLEAGVQVGLVVHGSALAAASGRAQLDRVLDALARLPDDQGTPLSQLLASSACRHFGGGLQVIITTDRQWQIGPARASTRQRWVVLSAAGFATTDTAAVQGSPAARMAPWLWIPSPQDAPHLLRYGWSEARHGS